MGAAFPNGVFPQHSVQELVCSSSEQAAASGGLVKGILAAFGGTPHQVIFISSNRDKDTLWVMEEALKCAGLTAVVCESRQLDFRNRSAFHWRLKPQSDSFVLRNTADIVSRRQIHRWR
jgi:protein ImuA